MQQVLILACCLRSYRRLPSFTYRKEVRSTLNGVSAAAGKVGALIGILGFKPLSDGIGVGPVLILCGAISALALMITEIYVQSDARTERLAEAEALAVENDGTVDASGQDGDAGELQLRNALLPTPRAKPSSVTEG